MALKWQHHEILKPPSDEEVAVMSIDELERAFRLYHEAIFLSVDDPYHHGFVFDNWKRADSELYERDELLVLGGNRCLGSDQEIYDPVSGVTKAVSKIKRNFHVLAWDGRKLVKRKALKPFKKERQKIYRVTLDNGQFLHCSGSHVVLTLSGWHSIDDLAPGTLLFCPDGSSSSSLNSPSGCDLSRPESISEHIPSGSPPDARHSRRKAEDSPVDCHPSLHSGDGQPRSAEGTAQASPPSRGGAPGCISCASSGLDGLPHRPPHSQRHSPGGRLSSSGVQSRLGGRFSGILSRSSGKLWRSILPKSSDRPQIAVSRRFSLGSNLQKSNGGSVRRGSRSHYVWPCADCIPVAKIVKIDFLRVEEVWDIEVPGLHNYLAGGVIHHNSSKTRYGARSVVRAAVENPRSEIFCFAQTSEVSIRQQQAAVWEWLPKEFKTKTTSADAYISYTKKNGFTDGSLILPNGSQIIFKTYSQFQNNPTILEGAELGSKAPQWINVGCWLDEYLLGPELIDTIRFRLATRNAKLLVTFTPIDGWTEVIRDYLNGAKTIESKAAELLGGELVPFVQHSHKRNAAVIYFHSKDNPFGGYERIANNLKTASRETILIRAYGVPTKSFTTKFPKFSVDVNVVPPERIPTKGVTRYQIIDPAGRKNWFMAWIAVDASGSFWVYREWPGVDIGEWAEQGQNGKWKEGEGAKGQGLGLRAYLELIAEAEGRKEPRDHWNSFEDFTGGEEIFERLIDPRLSASKYQKEDGESCILDDLLDLDFDVKPARGDHIEDGIQKLVDLMDYDQSKPIDGVNRPHFYVSENCRNIIQAIAEYTGEGGKDEAWKDPIDAIRYAAASEAEHVEITPLRDRREVVAAGY